MKVTLRQIEEACRVMNNRELAGTPWGVMAERRGDVITIVQVLRKKGSNRTDLFSGPPREVMAFLSGFGKAAVLCAGLSPVPG